MKTSSLLICIALLTFAVTVNAADDSAKILFEKAGELEKLSDSLTEKAEKTCYWGKSSGSHTCMEEQVGKYNQEHGEGSFEFLPQLNIIRYSGIHYRQLMQQYPNSSYAGEADFTLLGRNLVGSPDVVLPKVKEFLSRHPSGEWHCKGEMLLGRLHQDIWWIHKKWSWVLYGWKMSEEDLIVKAEPYREEALRQFEKVAKECKGDVKSAAQNEAKLLKSHKDDGKFYGIVNETMLGETQSVP